MDAVQYANYLDILKKDLKDIKVTGIFIDGDFNIKVVKEV